MAGQGSVHVWIVQLPESPLHHFIHYLLAKNTPLSSSSSTSRRGWRTAWF